jgi:8-oxo-dGTP pyrophosphatase MutT (NUDIX family)
MSGIVGCIFVSKDSNRVLLLRRSDKDINDKFRGYWSFLTGHMDDSELPYQAMDRETNEEIGVKKNTINFIKKDIFKTPSGKKFHFYYAIVPKEFTPILNKENMDYKWVSHDEIPSPLYPGTKEKIESILTLSK